MSGTVLRSGSAARGIRCGGSFGRVFSEPEPSPSATPWEEGQGGSQLEGEPELAPEGSPSAGPSGGSETEPPVTQSPEPEPEPEVGSWSEPLAGVAVGTVFLVFLLAALLARTGA
jgi:hypothetical protein